MAVQGVQNNSKVTGGLCPHGLPPGACPICSGGGAGGAKKADFTAKPGEMSWNECAAIGQMMRAQKLANQMENQAFENRLISIAKFENNIANMAQKIANFAVNIVNSLPNIMAKPINIVINKIILPTLNMIKNIPMNILKTLDNIKQKFVDIQDKLNAMFGEMKNAVEKRITDTIANLKKKIQWIWEVQEVKDVDDEEKKVENDKRAFEVKTFIHDIYNKISQTANAYGKFKKKDEN